jgi:hypothetical protein
MRKGINKATNFTNTLKSDTQAKMNIFGAKVEVKGHTLRVNNAMNTAGCLNC